MPCRALEALGRIGESENQRIGEAAGAEGWEAIRIPVVRPTSHWSLVIWSLGHFDCPVGHWRRSDESGTPGSAYSLNVS